MSVGLRLNNYNAAYAPYIDEKEKKKGDPPDGKELVDACIKGWDKGRGVVIGEFHNDLGLQFALNSKDYKQDLDKKFAEAKRDGYVYLSHCFYEFKADRVVTLELDDGKSVVETVSEIFKKFNEKKTDSDQIMQKFLGTFSVSVDDYVQQRMEFLKYLRDNGTVLVPDDCVSARSDFHIRTELITEGHDKANNSVTGNCDFRSIGFSDVIERSIQSADHRSKFLAIQGAYHLFDSNDMNGDHDGVTDSLLKKNITATPIMVVPDDVDGKYNDIENVLSTLHILSKNPKSSPLEKIVELRTDRYTFAINAKAGDFFNVEGLNATLQKLVEIYPEFKSDKQVIEFMRSNANACFNSNIFEKINLASSKEREKKISSLAEDILFYGAIKTLAEQNLLREYTPERNKNFAAMLGEKINEIASEMQAAMPLVNRSEQ